jgi:GNAT superfamily N-acetyltransferase
MSQPPAHEIIHLTDATPAGAAPAGMVPTLAEWLARAEPVHRALRPHLPPDYPSLIRRVLAEGAELALLHEAGAVRALAMFRAYHNTYDGYRFYVDDLVTAEVSRSRGFGAALLRWCEALARARGCDHLALDSGVQRDRAHRLYFREGMAITAFSFRKRIMPPR